MTPHTKSSASKRLLHARVKVIRTRTKMALYIYEGPYCLLCGQPGTDLHEWVTRKQTMGNSEARLKVYADPNLCAILCNQCNQRDSAGKLTAQKKIELYGWDTIQRSLDGVSQHLRIKIRLDWYLTD